MTAVIHSMNTILPKRQLSSKVRDLAEYLKYANLEIYIKRKAITSSLKKDYSG